MPASELMNQGSHAPNTGRQAEANSGSVPMHAHVHDTHRRFDETTTYDTTMQHESAGARLLRVRPAVSVSFFVQLYLS